MSGYELAQGQPRCGNLGRSVASQENSAPGGLQVHRSPRSSGLRYSSGPSRWTEGAVPTAGALPSPTIGLTPTPSPVTRLQPASTRHTAPTPDSYPGRMDRQHGTSHPPCKGLTSI